jgi:hypothetical protein
MSKEWIINDAYFGKIKDMPAMEECIWQFINETVRKHPNSGILLPNLSNLHVLVASYDTQTYLKPGEKTWEEIMKKDQYDILSENRYYVIAYMMITKKTQKAHYIELFDTIVRNNNLGYVMIRKYEETHDVELIPKEIIKTSAKYWSKILGFRCKEDIDECIKDCELNSKDLRWEHLYNLYNLKDTDTE